MRDHPRRFIPAAGCDWLLPLYDPFLWILGGDAVKRPLIEQAALESGMRALDIGCGTGSLTLLVEKLHAGVEVVGLDPDPKARRSRSGRRSEPASRSRSTRASRTTCPTRMRRSTGSSRRSCSTTSGPEEKLATLREVRRVLAPGGSLHLLDFGPPRGGLSRALAHVLHRAEHLRDNLEDRIPALMGQAGFVQSKELGHRATLIGSLSYYRAVKAARMKCVHQAPHRTHRPLLGWFLAGIGSWSLAAGLQHVVFTWLVVGVLHESPDRLGVAQMCQTLPMLLFLLFGGLLADRVELRRLLIALHLTAAGAATLLAMLVWADRVRFELLLFYALGWGTIQAFASPARDAMLSQLGLRDLMRAVTGMTLVQFAGIGDRLAARRPRRGIRKRRVARLAGVRGARGCAGRGAASARRAVSARGRRPVAARGDPRGPSRGAPLAAALPGGAAGGRRRPLLHGPFRRASCRCSCGIPTAAGSACSRR